MSEEENSIPESELKVIMSHGVGATCKKCDWKLPAVTIVAPGDLRMVMPLRVQITCPNCMQIRSRLDVGYGTHKHSPKTITIGELRKQGRLIES